MCENQVSALLEPMKMGRLFAPPSLHFEENPDSECFNVSTKFKKLSNCFKQPKRISEKLSNNLKEYLKNF
jgi:hypothetical protein